MISLTLRQVQEWTGGESSQCDLNMAVQRLTIDSRDAGPGVLFVALPGTRTDGHAFVEEVWRAGGTALVRRDFAFRGGPIIRVDSPLQAMGQLLLRYVTDHRITVVGVTGSVGKTSIKELSAAVLRTRYVTTPSLGNYNTVIGLPLSFFAGDPATTHFVAEMGMRGAGEILQLTRIAPPDVAVISTIGPSHLELMGSMEAIQRAKGEILQGLKTSGLAVLNRDNPWVRELGEGTGKRVAWFGSSTDAAARVVDAQVRTDHTEIRLVVYDKPLTIRLPWLGVHQAANVAAAVLVGYELGIELDEAAYGVAQVEAGRSRIHVVPLDGITVLEDVYNSSPLSAKAALDVLSSRTSRRVAVIGDMLELGSAEAEGHREVGEHARGRADVLLAVGQRSRHTFEAARLVGVDAHWVETRDAAAAWLKANLSAGDTVLLKASRGLEFERLTQGLADRRAAR
jgi:UDP-N-acetylmuramoyl-tripeptide--D-alanyl-D-alanine ligase